MFTPLCITPNTPDKWCALNSDVGTCIYNKCVPRKRRIALTCPTCKQPVKSASADFPFCSERCRLIDLGKWASGQYVVSSPLKDIDEGSVRNSRQGDDDH